MEDVARLQSEQLLVVAAYLVEYADLEEKDVVGCIPIRVLPVSRRPRRPSAIREPSAAPVEGFPARSSGI